MPAQRLLPDSGTLIQLRNKGWTYNDIAAQYGVTKGAVYLQLRDARATTVRPTYSDLLPWTVRKDHVHAFPAQMLRLMGRRQTAATIPPVKERMLDKWLREVQENDVVVCYQADMPPNAAVPQGWFYYSKRVPSDGDSLIRNDGTRVKV